LTRTQQVQDAEIAPQSDLGTEHICRPIQDSTEHPDPPVMEAVPRPKRAFGVGDMPQHVPHAGKNDAAANATGRPHKR
jgi:hypothetical protein